MAKGIKIIKLNKSKMRGFVTAFNWAGWRYEPENDHELLLYHHLVELRGRYEKMIENEQKSYGIVLSPIEVLAFCQIWAPVPLEEMPVYEALVIQEVLNEIDQHRKALEAACVTYEINPPYWPSNSPTINDQLH